MGLDAFGRMAPEPLDPELDLLSAREREVLRYIARGYAYPPGLVEREQVRDANLPRLPEVITARMERSAHG